MRNKLLLVLIVLGMIISGSSFLTSCGNSSIQINSLKIDPEKQSPGDPININLEFSNISEKTIDYTLLFKVNNVKIEKRTITLEAGQTEIANFVYSGNDFGTYQVDINGQKAAFEVVRPANFVVEGIDIISDPVVAGEEIQAAAWIKNDGELAGTFAGKVRLDGLEDQLVESEIEPGGMAEVPFYFTIAQAGQHTIDLNEESLPLEVIAPAKFEVSNLTITPKRVIDEQKATVSALVTNTGGLEGKKSIEFKVSGRKVNDKVVTIAPGESQTVEFLIHQPYGGNFSVGIDDTSGILEVLETEKFENYYYHYTIPVLEDYSVDQIDPGWVYLTNETGEGLVVITERVNVGTTAKEYLDAVVYWCEEGYQDWQYDNVIEVKEYGNVIGYTYNYSYHNGDVDFMGIGLVEIRGVLGYNISFETKTSMWEKNGAIGQQLIGSFSSSKVYTGEYTDYINKFQIDLPESWGALELNNFKSSMPIPGLCGALISPAYAETLSGHIFISDAEPDFSFEDSTDDITRVLSIFNGISVKKHGKFDTTAGLSGYKIVISYDIVNSDVLGYLYCVANDDKLYWFLFVGYSSEINRASSNMDEIVRSFEIY